MELIDFGQKPSLVSIYMSEMRDINVQTDPMRFRLNLRRIGQIMAYEISRRLDYEDRSVRTPLGNAPCKALADKVVLATILRAGLPFHEGFLSYFDNAENAFVSAYRRYREKGDAFDVIVEYMASPSIEDKTLLIVDPMLATGSSMELAYRALRANGKPRRLHIASAIASNAAVDYIRKNLPSDTTLWVGDIDPEINAHSYIVPGLGDAGDLAYGKKERD